MKQGKAKNCMVNAWNFFETGYKAIFFISLASAITNVFIDPSINRYFPNIIEQTVQKVQLWRLFSSSLIIGIYDYQVVLNLILCFYFLRVAASSLERQYSTSYILIQSITQLMIYNTALVVIGYPFVSAKLVDTFSILGYGLFPLIINYLWQTVSTFPGKTITIFYLPLQISVKYLPWIFLVLSLSQRTCMISHVIYFGLAAYQHGFRKRSLLTLPICVYQCFDKLIPGFIKNEECYVKVQSVYRHLSKCSAAGFCDLKWSEGYQDNLQVDRIEQIVRATSLGGTKGLQKTKFSDHWSQKQSPVPKEITSSNQLNSSSKKEYFEQKLQQINNNINDSGWETRQNQVLQAIEQNENTKEKQQLRYNQVWAKKNEFQSNYQQDIIVQNDQQQPQQINRYQNDQQQQYT